MPKIPSSESDVEKEHISPEMDRESSPTEKIGTFTSLRIPNFRLLLTGTTLSYAANWIQQVTLGWLVYDMTGSGTILGTINFVRSIASLGMIPIVGLLIDSFKRRNLLMIVNSLLFSITLALGLMLVFGQPHISYLFVFSFLAGLIQNVDNTLRQVLVFDLTPRSNTPNAIALIQTGWSLMRSFGPAIGGFLILWLGPGGNFLVQAGAYVLIIITIIQIQFPAQNLGLLQGSPLKNIKEAIRYIMKERVTWTFIVLGFILHLFIIPIFSILPPIYAVEVFGDESGKVLGFLMASVGLGGIAGGIVTASLGRLERRGLLQLIALFLLSISLIGFAFSTTLLVALLFLVLSGFFEIIFLTTNQTLIQLSIPDNLRGRVTSILHLSIVLTLLGGLVAGIGSDLFGGPKMITIILAGVTAAISIYFLLFSPIVRNYRMSQAIKTGSITNPKDSNV